MLRIAAVKQRVLARDLLSRTSGSNFEYGGSLLVEVCGRGGGGQEGESEGSKLHGCCVR